MDQKEVIQNEKVCKEAVGLDVKSPTVAVSFGQRKGERMEEPVVKVVEVMSEDNISIVRKARQWIRWISDGFTGVGRPNIPLVFSSEEAQKHLKGIMQGVIPSERQSLFFDKKEREGNHGGYYSRLNKLANTTFLGDNHLDTIVIKRLQEIFHKHVNEVSSYDQTSLNFSLSVFISTVLHSNISHHT